MCVDSRLQETGYWFWVVYTARKLCMVKFGTSFFRRLILNLSSRCLVGEHRTFLTLCFEGSYGFLDPSTKSCIKNGNHWSLRSRLYICTISHLLVVKKKKPNHFARSKFDRNFTTGLNKLSRIVGSRHTLQCLCNMLLGSLSPVFQNTR